MLLEKHPKTYIYIFFFSFSSTPNKFIKIYFIHFFFSFTHCKSLENFFTSFFFHLILDHFVKNFSTSCSHTNSSVQHLLLCYSPSIQIIHTTHNNPCYTHNSHIKHHACSVLIMSHDFLGNHILNLPIPCYNPSIQHRAIML